LQKEENLKIAYCTSRNKCRQFLLNSRAKLHCLVDGHR